MTVEHDGCDGAEDFEGFEGFEGPGTDGRPDPLMAVLTGEPLPDEVRTDAAFMAEHRSAEADVALLRAQLGLLGHALAEPEPEPEPQPEPQPEPRPVPRPEPAPARTPVRRRRPFLLAVRVAGVTCAVGVFSLLGWLVVSSAPGGAADDSGGSNKAASGDQKSGSGNEAADLSAPGYLACARLIAEGDVTAVEPVPGAGQDRITLRVTRHLKPARGPAEVSFPMDRDVDPRPRTGDHVLISIPEGSAVPDVWSVGAQDVAEARAWITRALPESRTIPCE
ncbi:hypothetical protein [Streptomyces sp. NPDC053367]|uniref:hypothetical protein n=1 Tax=Streptomyces sp. NPDC053367 TaxID=3365700 RepID=UPI0037D1846F